MSKNAKRSSPTVAQLAATTLSDSRASKTAKSLAGSALAQTNTDKQTGAELENRASRVLQSPKYSDDTKSLEAVAKPQTGCKRAKSRTI